MIYRNGLPDKTSSIETKSTVGFSAVRATFDSQRGVKGRIMLENTFANLNRGWLPTESLFQCHYPGSYKLWKCTKLYIIIYIILVKRAYM